MKRLASSLTLRAAAGSRANASTISGLHRAAHLGASVRAPTRPFALGVADSARRSLSSDTDLTSNPFGKLPDAIVTRARRLDQILKSTEAVAELSNVELLRLWAEYHNDRPFNAGLAWEGETFDTTALRARATKSPLFLMPVVDPAGKGFYNLMAVYDSKEDTVFMTYLDNYKKDAKNAQPWLALQLFPALPSSKMCLAQASFAPYFTKTQASGLSRRWVEFYAIDALYTTFVEKFNDAPEKFDFKQAFPECAKFL